MMKRFAALTLALAGACSAQADSDYEGDLLASLEGQVTTSRSSATPDAEAMAIWLPSDDYDFLVPTADRVDVEGSFPSAFRLDMTEPPPDEGSIDGSGDLALGFLTIVSAGLTQEDILQDEPPDDLLFGVEEGHMLLWVGTEDGGGSFAEFFELGSLSPGYHVLDVLGLTKAEDDQVNACQEAAMSEEESQACFDMERDLYEQRYPDVDWGPDDLKFDKLRLAADDLDTELAIDLKDSIEDMDFPEFN